METKIQELLTAAHMYKQSDRALEDACGTEQDPIACTVYARNGMHLQSIPPESIPAAQGLGEVVRLHGELVSQFGMNNDAVRALWFPILNAP